jgi:hypothetical protein
MFIAVRIYDGTGDATEINRIAQSDLAPLLKAQPGFLSYDIADAGTGSVFSISMFDTREQAEAANRMAREVVQKMRKDLMPNPPSITVGEALSHITK